MIPRGYTVLGWVTWQVAKRVAKRKMGQNKLKLKLGSGAAALGLLALGVVGAAKAITGSGDDD